MLPSAHQVVDVDHLINQLLRQDGNESGRYQNESSPDELLHEDGSESIQSIHEDNSIQSINEDGRESIQSINEDGSELIKSLQEDGSESIQSLHEDGSESIQSLLEDRSESIQSLHEDESESIQSLLEDRSESIQSLLEDRSESIQSLLEDRSESIQSQCIQPLSEDRNKSIKLCYEDGKGDKCVQPLNESENESIQHENGSESSHSLLEDANESDLSDDVIDIFDEKDEDLIKKLDDQPWVCDKCYPRALFHKRNLYVIHRARHFSEDHFICPICRKGFVKLKYCINHELTEHKDETQLNNQGLASAIPIMIPPGRRNTVINTQNNSKTENNVIYSGYAVASTSLYPYCGPPVEDCYDTYDIQYKFGRPEISMANGVARTARSCRLKYQCPRQEMQVATDTHFLVSVRGDFTNGYRTPVSSDDFISDYSEGSWGNRKRKKYRKRARKVRKPEVKTYCCNICSFTSNLESEFKEHSQKEHPNFTENQVLQFVLPSLGSYSPVRKKKTNIDPPPRKRIRYELSDDSTGESAPQSSISSFTFSSSPPESISSGIAAMPDVTTKEGFCSSLGLIRNKPS